MDKNTPQKVFLAGLTVEDLELPFLWDVVEDPLQNPDLAVIDLTTLGSEKGFLVADGLRGRDVPVLFLHKEKPGRNAGPFDVFLEKPVSSRELGFAAEAVLSRRSQKENSRRLLENEAQFRNMFENMQESFTLQRVVLDEQDQPVDCLLLEVNKTFEVMTGLKRDDVIGKTIRTVMPGTQLSKVQEYAAVALTGVPHTSEYFSNAFQRPVRVKAYRYRPGEFVALFEDMTEKIRNEEKIRDLIVEKDQLLREVHHRIKNNMSSVMALLFLQGSSLSDPEAAAALQDAENRVRTMAMLYDKLYVSDNLQAMSLLEYLPPLLDEIISVFPNREVLTVHTEIEDLLLDVDVISSLGILVNELITNSMKYAFVGKTKGGVWISAKKVGSFVELTYQDDGHGIPDQVELENSPGFGLQLVSTMARKIGAKIRIERGSGTKIVLEFPWEKGKRGVAGR